MGGPRTVPTATVRLTPAQFQVLEALAAHGPAQLQTNRIFQAYEHAGRRYVGLRGNVRRSLISARWIHHDGAAGTWSLTDAGRELAAREEARRARKDVIA